MMNSDYIIIVMAELVSKMMYSHTHIMCYGDNDFGLLIVVMVELISKMMHNHIICYRNNDFGLLSHELTLKNSCRNICILRNYQIWSV